MDSIGITLGRTIKSNGGSYSKYEVSIETSVKEVDQETIAKLFGEVRSALDKQVKIDEAQ